MSREHEQLSSQNVNIVSIIKSVHPQLVGTPIAETTAALIRSLYFLVEKDPSDRNKASAVVRGSLIKRYVLGTPEGYQDIPHIFRTIESENNSELTNKVANKLAVGPIEIDIRMGWKQGEEKHVLSTITSSLQISGFVCKQDGDLQSFVNEDIRAVIQPLEIGTKLYPRTLFNVVFYKDSKPLLIIDLADLPDESIFPSEMRLSASSGLYELYSALEMDISDNRVMVKIDSALERYREGELSPRTLNTFGHLLREFGNQILWPQKTEEGRGYSIHSILESYAETGTPWREVSQTSEEMELFEKRRESYISDLLLYATYDPFLFLLLGNATNLFTYLPFKEQLDRLSVDENALFDLCNYMANELGIEENDQYPSISKIEDEYNNQVLVNPQRILGQIGPLLILRALNRRAQELKVATIPETIDYFVELMNPLFNPASIDQI